MRRDSRIIEVNGARLWVEEQGSGTPIILLHSGFLDSRIWEDQMDALADHFRVICFDLRGFGKSSRSEDHFRFEDDLLGLMQELNIEKAVLNGCSMGGSIAVDFTLSFPEHVMALILTGASMGGYPIEPTPEDVRRSQANASIVDRDEQFEDALRFLVQDPMWRQADLHKQERLINMFQESDLKWLRKGFVQSLEPPAFQRLEEIQVPTLVLVGERDSRPIREIAQTYQNRIANAHLEWLGDGGHLPSMERPHKYNQKMLSFLKELDRNA